MIKCKMIICNTAWVDVVKRHLEFLVYKFSSVSFMNKIDNDALFEEFTDY